MGDKCVLLSFMQLSFFCRLISFLSISGYIESLGHGSSVQSLSRIRLLGTPWTAARQASLSITNSWSLPKLMSTESVMPSNHLILCHPLLPRAFNLSQH